MTTTSTRQSTAGRVRHAGRPARPTCSAVRAARPASPVPARVAAVAPASSGTRLTARGRAVVVATLVVLLLAAFSLGRTVAEGSTTVQTGASVEQVTVQPGDTLWAVAERLAPGQDPRPVVDQLRRLNDLSSPELQAGQQLLLPVAR